MSYKETMNTYYLDGKKPDLSYNALNDPRYMQKKEEYNR